MYSFTFNVSVRLTQYNAEKVGVNTYAMNSKFVIEFKHP